MQSRDDLFDRDYHEPVQEECEIIASMASQHEITAVKLDELDKAIRNLNTGKAPDIHNLRAEHLLHCDSDVKQFLLVIVTKIFKTGQFPHTCTLREGLVSPFFFN